MTDPQSQPENTGQETADQIEEVTQSPDQAQPMQNSEAVGQNRPEPTEAPRQDNTQQATQGDIQENSPEESGPAESSQQNDAAPQPEQSDETVGQQPAEKSEENPHADEHIDEDDHPHDVLCNTVTARFGAMRNIGDFRHNLKVQPTIGTKLVVRSSRGVELATVIMPIKRTDEKHVSMHHITGEKLDDYISQCGEDYPFERGGKVLRLANQQDLIDFRHLEHSAAEAGKFCRDEISNRKLEMELVKVEHLLGGERIIFYFTAEHRVDFRDLVKTLANQFRTRIEMRQVGARDEARLIADYERCGQRCCCQQFLKLLRPVSMRMAKVQKATLDPSKISGRCGRLMCCLRYEDEGYEYLRKKLPRRNSWVRTEAGLLGRVVDTQIITQLVKIELPNREFEAIDVSDIAERDLPEPTPEDLKKEASKPKPEKKITPQIAPVTYFSADKMREIDEEIDTDRDDDNTDESQQDRKKRRRRRRRKPVGNRPKPSGDGSNKNQNQQASGGDGKSGSSSKRKRRRRGGKRRRPGGKPKSSGSSGGNNE